MSASLILICMDHMGSDMVEKFLTNWEHQDPRFRWSLFSVPVRATSSSTLGAPAAQEALASAQDRSVLGWVATPVSIVSSLRKEVFCSPTSGCNMLHTYSSVGLCWEQEGKEILARSLGKLNLTLEKGWTQTPRVCTITAIIHILSFFFFPHRSLALADAAVLGKKVQ